MKRSICLLLVIILCFSIVFGISSCGDCKHRDENGDSLCDACEESYTEGGTVKYSEGLEFVSRKDGTCSLISRGSCKDTDIIIPPVAPNGDKVVRISLFSENEDCADIKSIVVPDSVAEISVGAFRHCTGLESITVPFVGSHATSTGDSPHFGLIFGFEKLGSEAHSYPHERIPGYPYIDGQSYLFFIPGNLKKVVVSDFCTRIGDSAFEYVTNVEEIYIGHDVTSIGNGAFINCANLRKVTVGRNVKSIGKNAFLNCNKLDSVTFKSAADWTAGGDLLPASDISNPTTAAHCIYSYARFSWTRD